MKNHPSGWSESVTKRLRKRDGDECFFCGLEVEPADASVEHVYAGGGSAMHNLALAHERCNGAAGSLPVVWKVRLREYMRSLRGTRRYQTAKARAMAGEAWVKRQGVMIHARRGASREEMEAASRDHSPEVLTWGLSRKLVEAGLGGSK